MSFQGRLRLLAGLCAVLGMCIDEADGQTQSYTKAADPAAAVSPGDPPPAPVGNSGEAGAPAEGAGSPGGSFWLRGEYLLWWIKDSRFPALVTTGTPGAAPLPGALGQPGTAVLFGDSDVDNHERSGGRFTGGLWLSDDQAFGLEGGYFFLGSRSVRFDSLSTGASDTAIIARPFFDVISGTENSQLVAFPGLAGGDIHVSSSSRLQGAELNAVGDARGGGNFRVGLLGGFRFLDLAEGLGITETSRVNPALSPDSPFFGGSTIGISDQFDAHNYFYGGQVGARAEVRWGSLFVDVLAKVALGVSHEVVDVGGMTVITSPAGVAHATPAGFLAAPSNSGNFNRDAFAVVPEVDANVGYLLTDHVRAFVGYSFLYWSSVLRPGDQVDVRLSGIQIPTDTRFQPGAVAAHPAPVLRDTGFWAQGVSFGVEFRY
jgi:hypothetical protein